MSKIAVVYWSGTGNTEAMANEVAEGAKAAGAEVDVLTASEFGADKMDAYDAVAFGCRLWEQKNWKTANSSQCSLTAKANLAERRSHSSDLTDGETENGCVHGKRHAKLTERFLHVRVYLRTKHRMMKQ